eukprot:6205908-Pleurochrysis_carterae.AAC.1
MARQPPPRPQSSDLTAHAEHRGSHVADTPYSCHVSEPSSAEHGGPVQAPLQFTDPPPPPPPVGFCRNPVGTQLPQNVPMHPPPPWLPQPNATHASFAMPPPQPPPRVCFTLPERGQIIADAQQAMDRNTAAAMSAMGLPASFTSNDQRDVFHVRTSCKARVFDSKQLHVVEAADQPKFWSALLTLAISHISKRNVTNQKPGNGMCLEHTFKIIDNVLTSKGLGNKLEPCCRRKLISRKMGDVIYDFEEPTHPSMTTYVIIGRSD